MAALDRKSPTSVELPRPPAGGKLAAFHLAEASGPSLSLRDELAWLGADGGLEVAVPGPGRVAEAYAGVGSVTELDFAPLTLPSGPGGLPRFGWQLARDVRTFRAHIRRTRPAFVVAVTTMLPALLAAARAEGVPRLVYAAELVPLAPGAARRAGGGAVLRMTRGLADGLVCCSEAVAAQFRARGAPPIAVAYPPIDPDPRPGDRAGFRARHGIEPDAPCVAVVGSVSRGRGQDVLVRALPALRERVPGLRAIIVGEPHPRPVDRAFRGELASLAKSLGVGEAVAFVGYVDAVGDVYAGADAIAVPARREAFGRVAAEALVAGRPVVASSVGAIPEVLRAGTDALLVPPDDPAALATALARLLEDRELAARTVAAGAARVRAEFTPARSLERFQEVVQAIAARPCGGCG